jgi:hypothetical protein
VSTATGKKQPKPISSHFREKMTGFNGVSAVDSVLAARMVEYNVLVHSDFASLKG